MQQRSTNDYREPAVATVGGKYSGSDLALGRWKLQTTHTHSQKTRCTHQGSSFRDRERDSRQRSQKVRQDHPNKRVRGVKPAAKSSHGLLLFELLLMDGVLQKSQTIILERKSRGYHQHVNKTDCVNPDQYMGVVCFAGRGGAGLTCTSLPNALSTSFSVTRG